jgi:hypothetical protein
MAVLLLLLGVWGGWLIYRTSFVVGGQRYFCLFDDAMISMTYARNLVEGHGLNWARWGEPVEGFTHPLWMFLMVPFNALPLPLVDRSLPVQILSLLTLAGTVIAVRRLVLDHFSNERARHWMPAAVLTAFYYPLAYWTIMGMETGLQALLTVAAVHLALSAVHNHRDRHLLLWLVCTAAFLLRMDMLLLVVAVQLYVLLGGGLRREGRRSWLVGLAVFCGVNAAYEIFRWLYFHDLLPNTYYLKLTGVPLTVRFLRGLAVLTDFVREHLPVLLPVGFGVGFLLRRNRRFALPAAVFVLYCVYNVYVGGDAWDGDLSIRANRFLAFVMPLVFVLLNGVLNEILGSWRRVETTEGWVGRLAASAVTTVALLLVNGLWLAIMADENWREFSGIDRPPIVDRNEKVVEDLLRFQQLVEPQAVVASAWAGVPAYFTDYRMIDILGYNDRVIARMPAVVEISEDEFELLKPGHVKWSERRLLTEQRPDAFFQIWGVRREMGKVADVMRGHGYRRLGGGFWMRVGSPYVHGGAADVPEPHLAATDVLDLRRKRRPRRPS